MRIAILYACRFVAVIIVGAVFLATTTPTAITDAFEALLKPFAKIGVHAQEIALVMSLALRFLPTLGGEAKAIVDAQSARGGSIETGTFVQRIKAMVSIIIPVFAGRYAMPTISVSHSTRDAMKRVSHAHIGA